MTRDMDPDEWWNSLTGKRKEQIFNWVEQPSEAGQIEGQMDLLDEGRSA